MKTETSTVKPSEKSPQASAEDRRPIVNPEETPPPLTADFAQVLPGGKLDDSTYEAIEDALDKAEAPITDKGRWLTLADRVAALAAERDDADRKAGAAMRRLEDAEDTIGKHRCWLYWAKRERGYSDNISFDTVWAETCALADAYLGATRDAESATTDDPTQAREPEGRSEP